MKRFLHIIALTVTLLLTSSCMTLAIISGVERAKAERRATGADFGYHEADMNVKTIQRVSEHAALAVTGRGDILCVMSYFGEYYDGMIISGKFIRHGTYSYTSVSGTKKQVLLYLDSIGYDMLKLHADREL